MPEFDKVAAAFRALSKKQVLVGVPMETSSRAQAEHLQQALGGQTTISNASLGYVHEFGSPARNIPARPHLVPGVEKVMDEITARLTAAARQALDGNLQAAEQYLGQAGQTAVNSVQKLIRDKLSPPLAESTLIARRLRRPDIHYRARIKMVEEEEARRAQVRELRRRNQPIPADLKEGVYLRKAETAEEATPLLDTGSYMRSIVWVIRDRQA
jgi:hypothetical protein